MTSPSPGGSPAARPSVARSVPACPRPRGGGAGDASTSREGTMRLVGRHVELPGHSESVVDPGEPLAEAIVVAGHADGAAIAQLHGAPPIVNSARRTSPTRGSAGSVARSTRSTCTPGMVAASRLRASAARPHRSPTNSSTVFALLIRHPFRSAANVRCPGNGRADSIASRCPGAAAAHGAYPFSEGRGSARRWTGPGLR